ncbi:phosphopantothenoylcysteine decarboxylase-like [Oscarella lobularis]|uniref:phosphopantothenoylcysteine decarboxylase-like n=1 Tax=Oscarella lobularis TaxID=121494 RepID=UPI003313856F
MCATKDSRTSPRVLLGCTGSVASIKVPDLCQKLVAIGTDVRVIATEHAVHFFDPSSLDPSVRLYRDADEWTTWNRMHDPVLHIELRRWADAMVIAPLDANTLSKLAHGLCDNLLTCTARAWDVDRPFLFCPAMNTYMWNHPHTAQHVSVLESFGYVHVPPVAKHLACGDYGMGAMASVETIVESTLKRLDLEKK